MSLQGQGIGKATALRLVQEGASVVINYLSDEESAAAAVRQIGSDRAIAVQADVSSISDIEKLVDTAVQKFSKIRWEILQALRRKTSISPLLSTSKDHISCVKCVVQCHVLKVNGAMI
ncbi:hypothetical protein H2199_003060 [Coniosporium tulheliwenetii]|uniref:Uncharacterized protein n=1 Tax=Coniosporium tulheliwenetii TaxID=3383036 RepID=A0ACC2ZBA0_9PEZI|nr:hypothetical protein H2199_003060 [Cladosporium sp. JES 115]